MMGIKGVNSEFPCRDCRIQSQKGPSKTYYPALHPPNGFPSHKQTYNPLRLPIWESDLSSIHNKITRNNYLLL